MAGVQHFVHVLQKGDGFQIFTSAELVRNPLAGFTRIVEIEHRRDRIDAQAIEMIFVDPEQRVRNEKVLHFVAPVVEDKRAPVRLLAFSRVRVLIKMSSVEVSQAVRVARKMRRRPIEQHADAFLMAAVDEIHKIGGSSITAGHREITDGLVAPG